MKTKAFDCIKLKEECQQAVERKYGGLSPEERHERMRSDLLKDPVLGELYRRTYRPEGLGTPTTVVTTQSCNSKVAEKAAQYKAASDTE